MATATQFKEEGNALFIKKDFAAAHAKYTQAIAIDGQNAILYANRSACSFGLGKFQDAVLDATQATEIDPGYAKGWSRLAAAHNSNMDFDNAVLALQKALAALPKENLSPADLKQKAQYTEDLRNTKLRGNAAAAKAMAPDVVRAPVGAKMPWQIAAEMLPELHAAGSARYSSSVYVIHQANQEFEQGLVYLNMLRRIRIPDAPQGYGMYGHTDGLTCLTNGILRDRRVLRTNFPDWFTRFNDQANFEAQKRQAWTDEEVSEIKTSALARLKRRGWNDVRPAIAVTVRGRILRAVFRSNLNDEYEAAAKDLADVLDLLTWGRQVWQNESRDNRGRIFEDTFVVGVKALYLDRLLAAHVKVTGSEQQTILDTLLRVSQELVDDVEKLSPPPGLVDPGFQSSFRVYPLAEAFATMGYCHTQIKSSASLAEKRSHAMQAIKYYGQAAKLLPDDEEKHCWYLHCMLGPMLNVGAPRETVIGVVRAIREAMPKMKAIWKCSPLALQGRDAIIEEALRIAEMRAR